MEPIQKSNQYYVAASGGPHQRRGKSMGGFMNSNLFSASEQAINRQGSDFGRHQSYENRQNKSQLPSSLVVKLGKKESHHHSTEDMLLSPGHPYQFTENPSSAYMPAHQTLE